MMEKGRWFPEQVRDDESGAAEAPAWTAAFLSGLIVTGSVRQAVDEAGIDFEVAWALRREYPEFAMYWDRALRVHRRIMAGVPFLEAVAAEEGGIQ
jgi:hypothetical protein